MLYNFWRGERVRLRAIEQQDLDAMLHTTEEQDTELNRYEDHIHFPLNREQNRAQLEKLANRERTDDSFFWMVENNAVNMWVTSIPLIVIDVLARLSMRSSFVALSGHEVTHVKPLPSYCATTFASCTTKK